MRRGEGLVASLLLAGAACAVGFVVAYSLNASTQLLGIAFALALALIGAALVVLSHQVLPTEQLDEDYPQDDPQEAEAVAEIVRDGGGSITRKKLLAGAGVTAGCALGAAAVTPALSLGPLLDTSGLKRTPWRRGARLVDEHSAPLRASDVEEGAFYSAFPEGAPHNTIGAPVVLVRLPPDQLDLPDGRERWAPQGIVAYSKICTHAGCAIALYRYPLHPSTSPNPALVCPCHYSTFDPARGAEVLFGPAGRPLPQLPLVIDAHGDLRAGGGFSDHVGPSWAGVR